MKYSAWILLGLLATGCAGHRVYLPMNSGHTPLATGALWKGRVGLSGHPAVQVLVTGDITTADPQNDSKASVDPDTTTGFLSFPSLDFTLGLSESVDITTVHGLGLKWQFYGTPNDIGWVGATFASSRGGLSYETTEGSGATESKAKTQLSGGELGITGGYALAPRRVVYASLGFVKGKGETKITQSTQTLEWTDEYKQTLFSIGFRTGDTWYLGVAMNATSTEWDRAGQGSNSALGLDFGYQW